MSTKIPLSFKNLGTLNTNSNRVLINGEGSRELTNCGDIEGDSAIAVQPGYSKVLSAPLLADYTTGTVTVTLNGTGVTGSSTAWLANAVPGDIFIGPDGDYYTVESVSSDTALTLRTPYLGAAASGASYSIRARVWMLAPYYSASGIATTTVQQDYTNGNGSAGTFSNTEDDTNAGVSLEPSVVLKWTTPTTATGYIDKANYPATATKFTVAIETVITHVQLPHYFDGYSTGFKYRYTINLDDGSGNPDLGAGPFTANADTGTITEDALGSNAAAAALLGSVTLAAGTTYWLVVALDAATVTGSKMYFKYGYANSYTGFTPTAIKNFIAASATWATAAAPNTSLVFNFLKYPTTGTNTYISPIVDMGFIPVASGTVAVSAANKNNDEWFGNNVDYSTYEPIVDNYPLLVGDSYWYSIAADYTIKWTLDTSANADMSSSVQVTFGSNYTAATAGVSLANNTFTLSSAPGWAVKDRVVYNNGGGASATGLTSGTAYFIESIASDVVSVSATYGGAAVDITGTGNNAQYFVLASQTALSASVTGAANLKRYYRATYYLASVSNLSTPMLTGLSMTFPSSTSGSFEDNSYQLVGCKKSIYTTIAAGASTISTTEVPMGQEVRPCYYQQKVFWSTGGQAPKYWDGIAAAAALVSALAKNDGSAGVDPPVRGRSLILHNDKLMLGRHVELQYVTGGSSAQTDTILTDAGADLSTVAAGFKLYPDVTNWPRSWYTITAVDDGADTLTCSGATMTDVATSGDTYLVTRQYKKVAWYTEETEPADWPTLNLLRFGDGDDDQIQALVAWKSNLYIICRSQIWRVSGYGPTTSWSKDRISKHGGTLSPASIVDAADALYWWTGEGVVKYTGGTTKPEVVSSTIRDLAEDALNPTLRDEVTGCYFQGRIFWSYPTSDSGVNNRTLVLDMTTGNATIRDFGMYCPERFIDGDGTEALYFWEPTSGCICQYDESVVTQAGATQSVVLATQFITATDPIERFQPLYLKVTLAAGGNETIAVSAAADYVDTYTAIGTLVPVGSDVSGRTTVNATDTAYLCRFPESFKGNSMSIKLTFSPLLPVTIYTIEAVVDPLESDTHK